jgi:hypothetical protein
MQVSLSYSVQPIFNREYFVASAFAFQSRHVRITAKKAHSFVAHSLAPSASESSQQFKIFWGKPGVARDNTQLPPLAISVHQSAVKPTIFKFVENHQSFTARILQNPLCLPKLGNLREKFIYTPVDSLAHTVTWRLSARLVQAIGSYPHSSIRDLRFRRFLGCGFLID